MPEQQTQSQMVLDKPGHMITLYISYSCVDYGGVHKNGGEKYMEGYGDN